MPTPAPISKLKTAEKDTLLLDLNYLNLGEIKTFCRKRKIPFEIWIEQADGERPAALWPVPETRSDECAIKKAYSRPIQERSNRADPREEFLEPRDCPDLRAICQGMDGCRRRS